MSLKMQYNSARRNHRLKLPAKLDALKYHSRETRSPQ